MKLKKATQLVAIVLAAVMSVNILTPTISAIDRETAKTTVTEANIEEGAEAQSESATAREQSEDKDGSSSKQKAEEAPVYRNGEILIYSYSQLTLIGSGVPLTDEDSQPDKLGKGKSISSAGGDPVCYSLSSSYKIMQDITIPRHKVWTLPEKFSGKITGQQADKTPLYDKKSDTVYVYNPYQLAVMSMDDADTQPIMSGDASAPEFGTGKVIYAQKNDKNYLTYSASHNYVLSCKFSSEVGSESVSVRKKNTVNASGEGEVQFEGRDFAGQVTKTIKGKKYILIGNQEQLRAIGTGEKVYSAVYQTDWTGTHHVLDTDNGNPIMLYGGDADLLKSQNGKKKYPFHGIDNTSNPNTRYYTTVNQETNEPYLDTTHATGNKNNIKAEAEYTSNANYIIFRDIDLEGDSNPWTPLMFSGFMTGAVAESGKLWDSSGITYGNTRRPVISNVYVNQNTAIKVNDYIGIGFFATITNEVNADNIGVSAGQATVSNLVLSGVDVENKATTAVADTDNSVVNALLSTVGSILGKTLEFLLGVLSIGSIQNLKLATMLSGMLNARKDDPTIYATGAFAGRVIGDVNIDNCTVKKLIKDDNSTMPVTVKNCKDYTGGFVGYSEGVTQYSKLSEALGDVSTTLATILNVVPALGLGDLITILLKNALPLKNLIPTGYINPVFNKCTVENLEGTIGHVNNNDVADTNYAGGFVGVQIGTQITSCEIKDSNYTVKAAQYGGGFSGISRDAEVEGTLNSLGIDIVDESQIGDALENLLENLGYVGKFQTQSLLQKCSILNSTVNVNGGSKLGGFAGALAASYAIDCDIKSSDVANTLTVSGTGSEIGGFAGTGTVGWLSSLGSEEVSDTSLLRTVGKLAARLLSTDESGSKKLLSLVGLVPSAIMGCQIDAGPVTVHGGGKYVGGIVGLGQGIYITESSKEYMNKLTFWQAAPLTEKTAYNTELHNLVSVTAGGDFVGGIAGELETICVAGVLDSAVGIGAASRNSQGFILSQITVEGVNEGYEVSSDGSASGSDGDCVGGAVGRGIGGTIDHVTLTNLKKVEAKNNKAGGFIGTAGPADLVKAGGEVTVNLLGLNNLIKIKNLLKLGATFHVKIDNSTVTGIDDGYTVEAREAVTKIRHISIWQADLSHRATAQR